MKDNKDKGKVKDKNEALKFIKDSLLQADFENARNLKQVNLIDDEEFYSLIEKTYYDLMKSKKFISAIDLVSQFDLGFEKIEDAATQQYRELLMLLNFTDRLIDYIWYHKDEREIDLSVFKSENIPEKTLRQASGIIRKKLNYHISRISTE